MWYPPQQQHHNQQQRWHAYNHQLPAQQQQQQQSYSRTSYYCNTDESLTTNQATTTYVVSRNDENESFIHYHPIRADDIYVTGTDYYVTPSTSSYTDEMSSSSLPYQSPNAHWNPVIAAPSKTSTITNNINQNHPTNITPSLSPSASSSSPSSSACWDWLLYPPEIYSHLYIPSSTFIQQPAQTDDFDLLVSLPTWLLALLYPSMKHSSRTDDENDSDQEISSLHNNCDEPLLSMNIDKPINHVSSNLSLSSENTFTGSKLQKNRSSTPDTDDGYQSASDASRSDYSQQSSLHYDHHHSKDNITINVPSSAMPRRISYAAAVKPLVPLLPANMNNKMSPLLTSMIKTKNNSSTSLTTNEMLNNNNGQKLKFIAPRFERMHHAKQYPSTNTTTTNKDSSSSSFTALTSRTPVRSNNNNNNNHHHHHHQRNHVINSTRRR